MWSNGCGVAGEGVEGGVEEEMEECRREDSGEDDKKRSIEGSGMMCLEEKEQKMKEGERYGEEGEGTKEEIGHKENKRRKMPNREEHG